MKMDGQKNKNKRITPLWPDLKIPPINLYSSWFTKSQIQQYSKMRNHENLV